MSSEILASGHMLNAFEKTLLACKPVAATPAEKTHLQRQIEATDGQIDRLVYELYGLTEEEIGIVEKVN